MKLGRYSGYSGWVQAKWSPVQSEGCWWWPHYHLDLVLGKLRAFAFGFQLYLSFSVSGSDEYM